MTIQFEYPFALYLLILPALLGALLYFQKRKRNNEVVAFSSPWKSLRAESRRTRRKFRLLFAFTLLALIATIFVLARPVAISYLTQKIREGVDIVIVLDVSESMEADDLLPSRIVAAKQVIRTFISKREGDRIGLVIFGGEAITKSPLTSDHDFLLEQVEDVKLRELKQGTAIGMGLANGLARLRQSEAKNRVVVLLTDGDSNVGAINPITAAHLAHQEGVRVYTIGIGKEDRVLVPIYSIDAEGRKGPIIAQVPSYLNPPLLKEVAQITGGKAYMARDNGMLENVLKEIDSLEKTKIQIHSTEKREPIFFIPGTLAALLFICLWWLEETRFRRARLAA